VNRIVLDASVALSWFIDKPSAEYATGIRRGLAQGGTAVVPAIWRLEVANGFVTAERRGLLTSSDTAELMLELDVIVRSVETSQESLSMRRLIAASRQFRLTPYDAAYLELARDQQLPLATLDKQLQQAAREAGIPIAH
jgi:predicted nucleic acid-binding protein